MIRKRIEGSLDDASFKTLMLKKKDFCWTNPTTGSIDHDEPTMLQIIINGINPTTRVGVSDFKKAVQNAKLSTSSNNVKDMLDDMTSNYQEIIAQQNTHGGYTMHLFDALLTSKNEVFRSMVQRKKDDWELGGEVYNSKLIDECVTKYNNMQKQNLWNHSDSKDAKIIALATKIGNIRKAFLSTFEDRRQGSKGRDDFHLRA